MPVYSEGLTPAVVEPHTHVNWINESPTTVADHLISSHGLPHQLCDDLYSRGSLVTVHNLDHPDSPEGAR